MQWTAEPVAEHPIQSDWGKDWEVLEELLWEEEWRKMTI